MKKSLGAETILYPTPVWVIGSYDKEDRPNVMTASWAGICCSDPPAIVVSIRDMRCTFENIKTRGAFTVNVPHERHVKETDYFGIKSGKSVDKLKVTGLKVSKGEVVDAPYVEDFPLVAECKLIHTLKVGVHTMFVGEIMDVKCDEDMLDESGIPDMEKIRTFTFDPAGGRYYKTGAFLAKAFSAGMEIG